MKILLAFLESKWKKPGKTTPWTPVKRNKKQKTIWSTGEEATDTLWRAEAARVMLQGGVVRPTVEWRLRIAQTPASQWCRFNRAELQKGTYRYTYIHPEMPNRRAFCRNSSEIQKFDEISTVSMEFGEIPRKFHQNRCKIRWTLRKIAKILANFWKLQ